ncbi:nuclear receptor 2C2-associated protein [Osmia bicornis bicornis]|uniref:nuclear receptor 2C2-associated protein n=1 Tax=Osmia bicornis bicornis TaxID=1437191 RepID=UPI0010F8A7EB|nr:nuclear receptor 2C2-associated protein [Osmia bicornis bicornis]
MTCLLTQHKFECRVSSVLNKNNRLYGRNYMFDNSPDTCWNSDAGTPQWIIINFEQECEVNSFEIEFQGGFVGKNCHLDIGDKNTEFFESFYPEDKNTLQKFYLKKSAKAKSFKFVFNESTDFFGRIIIYKLALYL